MIIELTLFPGRTKKQKKAAIEIITSKLVEALSIAPEDVFIIITEPPFENWGMADKQKGQIIDFLSRNVPFHVILKYC